MCTGISRKISGDLVQYTVDVTFDCVSNQISFVNYSNILQIML